MYSQFPWLRPVLGGASLLVPILCLSSCATISEGEVETGTQRIVFKAEAVEQVPQESGWHQWRGAQRDGVAHGVELPERLPEDPWGELWRVELGAGLSGPVLAEGKLFVHSRVGDLELTTAHDPETGAVLWSQSAPLSGWSQPWQTMGKMTDGPLATPAWSNGALYTVGVHGRVQCRVAATGRLLWEQTPEDIDGVPSYREYGHAESPLVQDGRVFVSLWTADETDEPRGSLLALDAQTGDLLWRAIPEKIAYPSPVWARIHQRDQVIVRTWERLVGLDPETGAELWSHEASAAGIRRDCATPLVVGDVVYLSNFAHGTIAVQVRPVGAWRNGRLPPDAPGRLEAVRIFRSGGLGCLTSSPLWHDDHLYGLHKKGRFACLDATTGKRRWAHRAFGEHLSTLQFGRELLALDESGELARIRLTPEALVVQQTWDIGEYTWAHPAVDSDRFYFRDGSDLVCLPLKETIYSMDLPWSVVGEE